MAEQAQVKSVEALEALRASFILYGTKAKRSVDMALEEVVRTRQWLQGDRRVHWEGQIRHWTRVLERARSERMTARLSALTDRSVRHDHAVQVAEQQLAHAMEKLKFVKRWARDFDNALGSHVRRLESVREHLMHDVPKATAWLHQALLTLEAYAESRYATLPPPGDEVQLEPPPSLPSPPFPSELPPP